MNRRRFLGQTLASSASVAAGAIALPAVLSGCASGPPRVDPVGVIDTHTHFYDPRRPEGVPWPPKDDAVLYRPVLPEEFQELSRRHGVTGTVVVEASSRLDDNQWVLDLAERHDFILGFVGQVQPGPDFVRNIRRFAVSPVFRGIRLGVWQKSALDAPEVRRDLAFLAEMNLSLDLLVGPDRLKDVARLAAALPNLRIIVDHCANVRVGEGLPPDDWRAGLAACESRTNVFMKVSGLVEGTGKTAGDAPIDLRVYRPTLEAVWQAFGEDRVIFGSNWPVSARFASYATVFNLVAEFFNEKGTRASDKYFTRNATTAYRLAAR